LPIDRVIADVEGNHGVAFDVEDCPQVALNHDGMDGASHDSGKPVDFMGSQPGSNGSFLKNAHAVRADSFCESGNA
jgi:hypothetical protein